MKLKQSLVLAVLVLLLVGCSENKEARIQKLETQNEQVVTQLEKLEARIQTLESNTIKQED